MACAYKAAAAVLYRFTPRNFRTAATERGARTVTVLSASHREPEGLGNCINTVHLLLAAVTKFGDGCFAMPALLASLPTEKRQS
jgi:hypothetical protein